MTYIALSEEIGPSDPLGHTELLDLSITTGLLASKLVAWEQTKLQTIH